MSHPPISQDVAGILGQYFFGGAGPSHSALTSVFLKAGLGDVAPEPRAGQQGPNKQQRVQRTAEASIRNPATARPLADALLSALRVHGVFNSDHADYDKHGPLAKAFARQGWQLSTDGHLSPIGGIELATGGREALDDQIQRLRDNTNDPALLLGTAKEMLESTAKFVLQELGYQTASKTPDFNELWYIARERLGILPKDVAGDLEGSKAIRAILQSSWQIVEQVNTLRNLQGTGHGRTLPSGVSAEQALLVVREACSVAEFALATLDRRLG